MDDSLDRIRREVIVCERCPRLVRYRAEIGREKKREFRHEEYWAKGVPGFGDPHARLVAVGLAPAAHGSNRTGRVFTGDRSAAFLVKAFHVAGFANQPTSQLRNDGLRYDDLYLTAAGRCAPPGNHPTAGELANCRDYLARELRLLTRTRAILALGGVAWEAISASVPTVYGVPAPRVAFAHGACAPLGPGRPTLWASYHPSPQNTQTGKLTEKMMVDLLLGIRASFEATAVGPRRGA